LQPPAGSGGAAAHDGLRGRASTAERPLDYWKLCKDLKRRMGVR
jgi:hypothetical protein